MDKQSTFIFNPAHPAVVHFLQQINTPWKMWLYLWFKLPSAGFWGLRVRSCTTTKGEVSIPYNWFTQNPFRSTYFAAQCGAAEMSTGLLAMAAIRGSGPVSMLVTQVEAVFTKKATGLVVFTCEEGQQIINAVERVVNSGEAQTITVSSVGVQQNNGQEVARMRITWSFKGK
ncbi:MAG: DUF4442 domain-containing protein [Saprospiraceae bacterium]|nr:DUF4442 domain-containing protein [Saprospiraceae bacterium]